VTVSDDVLRWLVDFAAQYLRNRYFPDKAVDLLEQCVAHAVTLNKHTVDGGDAHAVAERMIGMPLELRRRLDALRARVTEQMLLAEDDLQTLVNRLQVTMRGMDVRPARPNAVILLSGEAASNIGTIAQTLADALFGGAGREVMIDLSRFVHPEDVTMLIGAPPGYIGYSDALPLYRLAQMPWCVLRLEHIDMCHPQIRAVLTQALESGFITDARGRRLFLSDAVVLLTADLPTATERAIGFRRGGESSAPRAAADPAGALGVELAAQIDLVCTTTPQSAATGQRWVEEHLLTELVNRCRKQGLELRWDDAFIRWLADRGGRPTNQRDWERLVDETISPLLVPHLPTDALAKPRSLIITWKDGGLHVEQHTATEGGS
jgi:ATP-dependent Clp protease ATP-binding subunit ClpC